MVDSTYNGDKLSQSAASSNFSFGLYLLIRVDPCINISVLSGRFAWKTVLTIEYRSSSIKRRTFLVCSDKYFILSRLKRSVELSHAITKRLFLPICQNFSFSTSHDERKLSNFQLDIRHPLIVLTNHRVASVDHCKLTCTNLQS